MLVVKNIACFVIKLSACAFPKMTWLNNEKMSVPIESRISGGAD